MHSPCGGTTMMRGAAMVVASVLALAAGPAEEDAGKKDRELLQGTWTVVSAEHDGQPLDRIKGNTLTLKGDRFTIKTRTAEFKGTCKLDPTKKPKTIDFLHESDVLKDKTWQGIYSL